MPTRDDYIAPHDLKYVGINPDSDFDPERNKRIIEETIKWTDRVTRQKDNEALEKVKERTNAVKTYVHGLSEGTRSTDREKFFGKKYLSYLRGQEITEKIKGELMLQGRDKLFVIKPSERSKKQARKMLAGA